VSGGKIADRETEKALEAVLSADYTSSLRISNMHRRNVLDLLLKFYHEHMESLGEIKSIQVLREVFT
jgi:DNA repair protein RecO (recombination protein O)